MANFATESGFREKFQLNDTTLVSSALVSGGINDAHAILLRVLDPQFDTGSPVAALVLGETLLSGAQVLRSLAANDAFAQRRISVGGNRIDSSNRAEVLTDLAADAEERAWQVLEPFLLPQTASRVLQTTKTKPVLGEE